MRQAGALGARWVLRGTRRARSAAKEAGGARPGNAIAGQPVCHGRASRAHGERAQVGEGGSGGALALALADRVAMQEHAVYSVLSPEGFASILWKDRSRAAEAAAVMRMNAYEIFDMDIVDVVLERRGLASANPDFAIANGGVCGRKSRQLSALPIDELLEQRYERFRKF